MSQAAIPLQFEQYMQNQISIGKAPDMNEMVFAYIPDLDLDQPIDRSQGLPDSANWVHQQDIDQVGKVGNNALAYSVVIAADVAAFTFNAIYLRDKNVPNACGMVVHKPNETKEHGSSVTKSLLQEYVGAAQIVGIDVDAGTWQIDYQARLKGIDEDHRLACLDTYGHTAFIDGFEVTQLADVTKYKITEGIVYVGGLRGGLTGEVIQTITEKPSYIYVDLFRTGAVTSQWVNQLSIRVSNEELTDYIENAEQHYVAKIAQIDADGNVIDLRKKGGLAEHLNASDPHPQYATSAELELAIQSFNREQLINMVGLIGEFHNAGSIPAWVDLKGGQLSRTADKLLWDYAVRAEMVISQATKDAEPMINAMKFGDGDGVTTFTLPNHHLGHFVRGNPSGINNGETQGDAIRNITGTFGAILGMANSHSGILSGEGWQANQPTSIAGGGYTITKLDASLQVPTANENRPYAANLSIKMHRGWV